MIEELESCLKSVYEYLSKRFVGDGADTGYARLIQSMQYSLLAGGKRIRAIICMKFCEAAGGQPEDAIEAACAVEMLHTYSLIHDDLPCMDDDAMRRGKPSNHIEFGEFTAVLAGDALQAAAFETLALCKANSHDIAEVVRIFAQAAGPHGICGGQYLDLSGEGMMLTVDELHEVCSMKTAALLSAAARIGVIIGGGTKQQIEAADDYAQALGISFQVRDDILDCIAVEEELGKPVGSDSGNSKSTFASLLGVEACEIIVRKETEKAIGALNGKFNDAGFLIWLAHMLVERKY